MLQERSFCCWFAMRCRQRRRVCFWPRCAAATATVSLLYTLPTPLPRPFSTLPSCSLPWTVVWLRKWQRCRLTFLRPTPSPAWTASTELCTLEWQLQCQSTALTTAIALSCDQRSLRCCQQRRKSIKVGLFRKRRTQRGRQRAAFSVWVNCAEFPLSLCFFFVVFSVATGQRLTLTKLTLISFRLEFSKSAEKVNFTDSNREIQLEKLFDFKLAQREL